MKLNFKNKYKCGLCLIVCNTRSNSTLLLDLIRSIPGIKMNQYYDIYKKLKLKGRRYPKDLVNIFDFDCNEIETKKNFFEKIPIIERDESELLYFVEKIHPHFINTHYFIFKKRLYKYFDTIKIIFLIRHPYESLNSFIKYSMQNEEWGKGKKIPDFIINQYKCMYQLYRINPGLVVTNEEMQQIKLLLKKIVDYLEISNMDLNKLYTNFINFNDRMLQLRKFNSPFISNINEKIDLNEYKYKLQLAEYYYNKLIF